MHFFLYEWITGGGLVEETGALPKSLLAEGTAMVSALGKDLAAIPGASVSLLKDMRLDALPIPECEVCEVQSRYDHDEQFETLAKSADYVVVIAPEFDGILHRCHSEVEYLERPMLGCSARFVKLATDKQRTAERLAAAEVPVPEAVIVEAEQESLPADFSYPAVLKPIDGAGSQHLLLVSKPSDQPPPYAWPRRLERYCSGIAVSVSFLCGPTARVPLPGCRQVLSGDGHFAYVGGSRLAQAELNRRATDLASRALAALPEAKGYVGVDLILGNAADGSEDVVIEVNPRLTTSYVGLRAMTNGNLAEAMWQIANGEQTSIEFNDSQVQFLANGAVTLAESE